MRQLLDEDRIATQAQEAAARAAAGAGVRVASIGEWKDVQRAVDIFARVWMRREDNPPLNTDLLRALVHAGNYAAGAWHGDELVGALVGFLGRDDGALHLHSHILGVVPEMRSRSVGYALKQHQRAWALAQGIDTVTWTFDPLVRRNAYFNLARLGAGAGGYLRNFYGPMNDGINRGDESDRLLARWRLTAPRAVSASDGRLPDPDPDALIEDGAQAALDGRGGIPVTTVPAADVVLCAVPDDIVALRERDADVALAWRRALRDTLGCAMDDGYAVTGFARSGWYVLERT